MSGLVNRIARLAPMLASIAGLLAIAAIAFTRLHRDREPRVPAYSISDAGAAKLELCVPRDDGAIKVDGELDEPAWTAKVARTGAFRDSSGHPGKPYSDARFMWGNGLLYVALYAADEDIQAAPGSPSQAPESTDDMFHFEVSQATRRFTFDMNPNGLINERALWVDGGADPSWRGGLRVGHELDGTLNDPSDDDEEWVLELAIPLASFGVRGVSGERIEFFVRRCDTPHRGPQRCNGWGDETATATLVLE